MIKEALQYVLGLSAPHREKIGNTEYSSKELIEIRKPDPRIDNILIHTLQGIVGYIQKDIEKIGESVFIHVESFSKVHLYGVSSGEKKIRTHFVESNLFDFKGFQFGQWQQHELFMISLQTLFVPNEELSRLVATIGNMKHESSFGSDDDGITQRIQSKKGVTLNEEKEIKNPYALKPYRTFPEVEQPESMFVLRVRGKEGQTPECALYESDGAAWKISAINSIKAYFEKNLKEVPILA